MIIGIDAGTSVVKAVAFSDEGENLAVESRRTKVYSPRPDQSEQDFEEVVAAVGEVVRAVAESSGENPDAIGLTGQGDGLWLFDERGYSVRPAILWLGAGVARAGDHRRILQGRDPAAAHGRKGDGSLRRLAALPGRPDASLRQ